MVEKYSENALCQLNFQFLQRTLFFTYSIAEVQADSERVKSANTGQHSCHLSFINLTISKEYFSLLTRIENISMLENLWIMLCAS